MFPVYTADQLSALKKPVLEEIAAKIGAVPTADRRFKSSWVQAVLDSQATIVPVATVEEVEEEAQDWQEEVTTIIEFDDDDEEYAEPDAFFKSRDFIAEENAIIAQINVISDALNFAILSDFYSPDCPNIRKLEEDVDALNLQLQQVADAHREYIQSLCRDAEPIADIWWQGENNGAVSIDGGQTYRCFRVLDMLSDRPVIKLIVSKKQEIDSRWATTKNNRYIQAVLDAIPAHIKQIASEIWENGEVVGYGGENDEPPNRGDSGRGRIEANEWGWVEF
jgi:hypothetical protein